MKLEEISKLLGEITQGDWGIAPPQSTAGWGWCISNGHNIIARMTGRGNKVQKLADANFIAAAPTIIKDLLARNEELQRRVEKYKTLEDAVRIFHSPICGCPMCEALDNLDAKDQDDD